MAVLTSGFRFSIITACRFSNGRNRNGGINWSRSRMRDGFNCRCNNFPDFSSVSLFFPRLLRFESGGQSPGRIFKRVEIFDLTDLRHWKYPVENAENKCLYFVVDSGWGKMSNYFNSAWFSCKCEKGDIRASFFFFFLFKLDWKEAIIRYFMYCLSLLILELTEYGI